MTNEEIEKVLFENYDKVICECLDCYGVLSYIRRLKAENAKLINEADENATLAMEQKLRADKLEEAVEAERKETAKELLQELYDEAIRYGKSTVGIEWMAQKYGVEME